MERHRASEPGPARTPRAGRPRLRRVAAALTSLMALTTTSLVTGPTVEASASAAACALPRTAAHHSLGLDSWNGSYVRPDHPVDAVMIFLSFPDAVPRTTPRELAADHFPATGVFWNRSSYGKFVLRDHPMGRWLQMPRPSTAYRMTRDWAPRRRDMYLRDALRVADPAVDFSRYQVVYLVADPDAPGVDSDATKVVNFSRPIRADGTDIGRIVTVFEHHPPDRNVLAHETGHVFDLPDLYHRPTDGKGDWDTYVGDWDVMGSQFGLAPDLFGWMKWKLGWLDDRQVRCVQSAGATMLTLEPVSAPRSVAGRAGTRLAVIRTGEDSAIAVEARAAVGDDATTCTEGVLVYRVRGGTESGDGPVKVYDTHPHTSACAGSSVYPPLADAPLGVGETYTVPGERVTVEAADRTPSGAWTVKITTGAGA
ncbi:M6 family metalloprotease domain-containing protein [Streptomyces tremellae]|uniref:M6 family metalloprotease domain-containing protein n=2 Tax=Streptomyces tremellae TaxID=1124239 RepID=A0ABP7GDW9_9ACTN